MADTGAPWNLPYPLPTDLVRDGADAIKDLAEATATGLSNIPVLAGIGSNVAQTVLTGTFSTSSGTFTNVTGLTVAITPSSATSKVLVIAQFHMGFQSTAGNQAAFFRLNGGNSNNYIGATAGSRSRVAAGLIENQMAVTSLAWMQPQTLVYLDSPGSASSVTYALQARREGGGTVYVCRPHTWTDIAGVWSVPASITAIEVAA